MKALASPSTPAGVAATCTTSTANTDVRLGKLWVLFVAIPYGTTRHLLMDATESLLLPSNSREDGDLPLIVDDLRGQVVRRLIGKCWRPSSKTRRSP